MKRLLTGQIDRINFYAELQTGDSQMVNTAISTELRMKVVERTRWAIGHFGNITSPDGLTDDEAAIMRALADLHCAMMVGGPFDILTMGSEYAAGLGQELDVENADQLLGFWSYFADVLDASCNTEPV